MKTVTLIMSLGGALLLAGCAGTSSEFECNATTSDSCMTMEKANEKAKKMEEAERVKPDATSLPRLADGNFSTASATAAQQRSPESLSRPVSSSSSGMQAARPVNSGTVSSGLLTTRPSRAGITGHSSAPYRAPAVYTTAGSAPAVPPIPVRTGEQIASLWVAPWIDKQDVYHQPSTVFFIVKDPAWGRPRIN
ncbi:TPA: type IV conjugative transfer system lipoprotein TraV [Enterobacter roggenkampii]